MISDNSFNSSTDLKLPLTLESISTMKKTVIWRIYKTTFDAAHHIKDHSKCGRTHGHTYHLIVKVKGYREEWVDFHLIKEGVDKIMQRYDHTDMGEMDCETLIAIIHPLISKELMITLPQSCIPQVKLELWETEQFGVEHP